MGALFSKRDSIFLFTLTGTSTREAAIERKYLKEQLAFEDRIRDLEHRLSRAAQNPVSVRRHVFSEYLIAHPPPATHPRTHTHNTTHTRLPTSNRKLGVVCEKVTPFEVYALGNTRARAAQIVCFLLIEKATRDTFNALGKTYVSTSAAFSIEGQLQWIAPPLFDRHTVLHITQDRERTAFVAAKGLILY